MASSSGLQNCLVPLPLMRGLTGPRVEAWTSSLLLLWLTHNLCPCPLASASMHRHMLPQGNASCCPQALSAGRYKAAHALLLCSLVPTAPPHILRSYTLCPAADCCTAHPPLWRAMAEHHSPACWAPAAWPERASAAPGGLGRPPSCRGAAEQPAGPYGCCRTSGKCCSSPFAGSGGFGCQPSLPATTGDLQD